MSIWPSVSIFVMQLSYYVQICKLSRFAGCHISTCAKLLLSKQGALFVVPAQCRMLVERAATLFIFTLVHCALRCTKLQVCLTFYTMDCDCSQRIPWLSSHANAETSVMLHTFSFYSSLNLHSASFAPSMVSVFSHFYSP